MAIVSDEVVVRLEARIDDYMRKLDAAETKFGRTATKIDSHAKRAGKGVSLGFGLAAGAVGGFVGGLVSQLPSAIAGAIKGSIEYASSLGEVAQQLGVTSAELQEFRYIATQVGLTESEMDSGLRKLTVTLGQLQNGAKKPVLAFTQLGFSLKEMAALSTGGAGNAIAQIATKLAAIDNPAKRAAIEIALFGKAGQKLDTVLAQGGDAVDAFRQRANELGLVLSDSQINKADEMADKLAELKQQMMARFAGVVIDNSEAIVELANSLANFVVQAGKAIGAWRNFRAEMGQKMAGANAAWYEFQDSVIPDFVSKAPQRRADKFRRDEAAYRGQTSGAQNRRKQFRDRLPTGPDQFQSSPGLLGKPGVRPKGTRKLTDDPADAAEMAIRATLDKATKAVAKGTGAAKATGADKKEDAKRTAEEAIRKAREASEALRQYTDDLASLEVGLLDATAEMTGLVKDRSIAERARITADRDREVRAINADQDLDATGKAKKIALVNNIAQIQLDTEAKMAAREAETKAQEDRTLASDAAIQNETDLLQAQLQGTLSRQERALIEKRLVVLAQEQERLALAEILASQTATDAQKRIAQARLNVLNQTATAADGEVDRANASPGEQEAARLNEQFKNLDDTLEQMAVEKIGEMGALLGDAASKALGLTGMIGDVVKQLINMAIQMLIIKPLMNALFPGAGGAGGSGGIFASIGNLFGGGRAVGGPVKAGTSYMVGERGPEMFKPATSGNIIPNHRLGGGGGAPAVVKVMVAANDYFDARVAGISGDVSARTVRSAAPGIVRAATGETINAMTRKKM